MRSVSAPTPDAGGHYGRVMQRLQEAHRNWAIAIHLLTIVAVWPRWSAVAWVVGTTLLLVPINVWLTLRAIPRWGPTPTEVVRTVLNLGLGLVLYHQTRWPLPVWLWLPYVALAFDGSHRRLMWITQTTMWLAMAALSWIDGVPAIYSLAFGAIGFLCRGFTDRRVQILHEMFEKSEAQRRALDAAHAELQAAVQERDRAETRLRQTQKLEAIGRLASGIAHEINTPLQFTTNSVTYLDRGVASLMRLVTRWQTKMREPGAIPFPVRQEMDRAAREADLGSLEADMTDAVSMARDGLSRVSSIVQALKEFAHPDQAGSTPTDVNRLVAAVLAVSKHEYKYVADVETDLGELPPVDCRPGRLSEALLNLVINAAHAIADAGTVLRGRITIRTRRIGDDVVLSVTDTGAGIRASIADKVFEPFFTTKPVGRGTGQGLAIARAIVEGDHRGELTFEAAAGGGTTFRIRLPIRAADHKEAA